MVVSISPGGQTLMVTEAPLDRLFVGTTNGIYTFRRKDGSWAAAVGGRRSAGTAQPLPGLRQSSLDRRGRLREWRERFGSMLAVRKGVIYGGQ